jgi:hypothetical protein
MWNASAAPPISPDAERLAQIQSQVTADLKPVRPLPADRVLVAGLTILLLLFAVLGSFVVGHDGFLALSQAQKFVYYGAIVLGILGWSRLAVREAIPGSPRTPRPYRSLIAYGVVLALIVTALFRDFDMEDFVLEGYKCLIIGTVSAAVAGLLLWKPLQRVFFVFPRRGGALTGALCGLAGAAILALFCPLLNTPHIIVWHFAPIVIAAAAGAAIASLARNR